MLINLARESLWLKAAVMLNSIRKGMFLPSPTGLAPGLQRTRQKVKRCSDAPTPLRPLLGAVTVSLGSISAIRTKQCANA
jgi:hypothetical protein